MNMEYLSELSESELHKEFRDSKWDSVEYHMILNEIVDRKNKIKVQK